MGGGRELVERHSLGVRDASIKLGMHSGCFHDDGDKFLPSYIAETGSKSQSAVLNFPLVSSITPTRRRSMVGDR